MTIGEKIKKARLEKGYTQEELGKLIGVQKSAVAKYEKGKVVNIKRSVLKKISMVLDIPPVELVSDIEEKEKPINEDGLSENMKALIDFAKSVPEDKAELVLRVMKSILEAD